MIISVCGFKGGVSKTTTAVHLAWYFAGKGSVLLVDGDPNHSATGWSQRGNFPFRICDLMAAAKFSQGIDFTILDTPARPDAEELRAIAEGCDLLILPTSPDALAIEALFQTAETLRSLENCRVLLSMCDVRKQSMVDAARKGIEARQLPLFKSEIRLYTAYQKAALLGVPVYQSKDRYGRIAWNDYTALGKEIESHD